ncbi:MAG: hypothetical protein ACP5MD_06665 [Verrucomicrobiia bacterium]
MHRRRERGRLGRINPKTDRTTCFDHTNFLGRLKRIYGNTILKGDVVVEERRSRLC